MQNPEGHTGGIWRQNPALVQLLGLCPLLAVTTSLVNALGLAIATLFVLTSAAGLVSLARSWVLPHLRLPFFMLTVASLVTASDLMMQAWAFSMHQRIGLFVALVVTNCTVLARLEASASKRKLSAALADGFAMGSGFGLVLLVTGGLRELIGRASLGVDLHLLLGEAARGWQLQFADSAGLLLAILPPGGFLLFGLLLAGQNLMRGRASGKRPGAVPEPVRIPLINLDQQPE